MAGGFVAGYASALLAEAGVPLSVEPSVHWELDEPHRAWARSGAMLLTGQADGAPLLAPAPLATAAHGALLALRSLAGRAWRGGDLDGAALLGERAALIGAERHGCVAPGGACRLLAARGGWLAVNLARESDREMLPAWLERDVGAAGARGASDGGIPDTLWASLERALATRDYATLLERARLMGLAIADVPERICGANGKIAGARTIEGAAREAEALARPARVVDLSGLWAGPLCTHLLGLAGAEVVKCESEQRPDGARRGPSDFYDLLNANKRSVALAFASTEGRRALERLVDAADIVVESARPRALRGLGIDAERWVRERPGRTWVAITGYGRAEPEGSWVAFGDDAAAASGLAWAVARANGLSAPVFCGDAIADPLAGLHAAVFSLANHQRGTSRLIDLSLRSVVASLLECAGTPLFDSVYTGELQAGGQGEAPAPPRARRVSERAPQLGADTAEVSRAWGVSL
ncbi:MAG: CoA transferase [Myxococcota bacterium]|jgi:hypothetical protein|nr:CoA transferase [Myxococcota bacterium]